MGISLGYEDNSTAQRIEDIGVPFVPLSARLTLRLPRALVWHLGLGEPCLTCVSPRCPAWSDVLVQGCCCSVNCCIPGYVLLCCCLERCFPRLLQAFSCCTCFAAAAGSVLLLLLELLLPLSLRCFASAPACC